MTSPLLTVDAEIEYLRNRIAGIDAELSVPTTSLFFGGGLRRERDLLEQRLAVLTALIEDAA